MHPDRIDRERMHCIVEHRHDRLRGRSFVAPNPLLGKPVLVEEVEGLGFGLVEEF